MRADTRPLALLLGALLVLTACGSSRPADPAGFGVGPEPALARSGPCDLWYAIGDSPTTDELDAAAGRYDVVILNAWETDALARLRAADPTITVLVYKDLSSTRSYPGPVVDGVDDPPLPTGLGWVETDAEHPEWFAVDEAGARIEWDPFPEHWQMAVWEPGYRERWVDAVMTETVDAGFDGVFADNDFARLGFYDDAVPAGMGTAEASDELIRAGLDAFVTEAGTALRRAGKLLVPNVSEARLFPGRWAEHTRFGGGMEENFAYFHDPGTGDGDGGQYLTDADPTGWLVQTEQLGLPDRLNLAVTRTAPDDLRAQRYGFASAAVRGAGRTCWTVETVGDYTRPEWTPYQDIALGEPIGPGEPSADGVWTREFRGGWVAVNPTGSAATVSPPAGFDGGPVELPATDAVVRERS